MPIEDYRFNIPRPTEGILSGIQTGLGLTNIIEQRRSQQVADQRQAQVSAAMSELNDIVRPTAADYTRVANLLPKEQADSLRSSWELLSKDKQSNQLRFAGQVLSAFETSPEIALKMLDDRADAEENAGNKPQAEEYRRWAQIAAEEPDAVKQTMGVIVSALPGGNEIIDNISKIAAAARERAGVTEKPFAPVTLVNPKTGEKVPHIPTFDPQTGKARLEPANLPEGFELSKETPIEKRQAEVAIAAEKKGAEITGKGQAERRQVTINRGVESSEGLANLKRAKTLLETIKTGGINAASLRAKQLFGVEGADEGELSNRLGKAVLSQLKATFGAAFTAQEGASLARIEAGFGKSAKANMRLIDQLIKIVEKKGNQGIKAAIAAEDFEAAKLIKENMAFTLDIEPTRTAPPTTTIIPETTDVRSKADAILGGL